MIAQNSFNCFGKAICSELWHYESHHCSYCHKRILWKDDAIQDSREGFQTLYFHKMCMQLQNQNARLEAIVNDMKCTHPKAHNESYYCAYCQKHILGDYGHVSDVLEGYETLYFHKECFPNAKERNHSRDTKNQDSETPKRIMKTKVKDETTQWHQVLKSRHRHKVDLMIRNKLTKIKKCL